MLKNKSANSLASLNNLWKNNTKNIMSDLKRTSAAPVAG
jgi:hypothetical protein